jgi:hypothetical protein
MKKTEASKPTSKESDDMLPEYKFDYSKARPNRFAARMQKEEVTVTLDHDVSEIFTTSESVNSVLRALIETMPGIKGRKRARKESSQDADV